MNGQRTIIKVSLHGHMTQRATREKTMEMIQIRIGLAPVRHTGTLIKLELNNKDEGAVLELGIGVIHTVDIRISKMRLTVQQAMDSTSTSHKTTSCLNLEWAPLE